MTTLDEKARELAGILSIRLQRTVPVTGHSFSWFICIAIAAVWVSIEKLASRATRNNLVISSDSEGVLAQGKEFLSRDPYPAIQARALLSIPCSTGAVLPADTSFTCSVTGLIYNTDISVVASSTTISVNATCENAGTAGNFDGSSEFIIQSQIAGINSGTTGSISTSGVDAEPIEEYRVKVSDAKRYMGGGGNLWDLRIWGQEVSGVKRIYPYRGKFDNFGNYTEGLSARTVFVQSTESINSDGVAPQSLLDSVRSSCLNDPTDGKERIPASSPISTFYVQPIRRVIIDVKIYGSSPSWSANAMDAIESAVSSYLFDLTPYIAGVDPIAGRTNQITLVNVSGTVRDSASQFGLNPSKIELILHSTGAVFDTYTLPAGGLAKLGTITYP